VRGGGYCRGAVRGGADGTLLVRGACRRGARCLDCSGRGRSVRRTSVGAGLVPDPQRIAVLSFLLTVGTLGVSLLGYQWAVIKGWRPILTAARVGDVVYLGPRYRVALRLGVRVEPTEPVIISWYSQTSYSFSGPDLYFWMVGNGRRAIRVMSPVKPEDAVIDWTTVGISPERVTISRA